jgi:pyridoxal phosphate enzyme (YggS family)
MLAENLNDVRQRIARSCEKAHRAPDDVKLICVTKEASLSQIEEAISLGIRFVGENRVQDADAKRRVIGARVEWHLIGHLQTNKVRDAVRMFSVIHSVDSLRLASEIDKEAKRAGKVQDVLIQVNTSQELSKYGISCGELNGFIRETDIYQNINIIGLMTIAPEAAGPESVRIFFRRLRELRDAIRMTHDAIRHLSMGMTNDFEIAIEEGATMVRVGRAIFS